MPLALKAQWVVTAGVVPGESMKEYQKVWHYDSYHFDKDVADREHSEIQSVFVATIKEVHDYAMSITDPSRINWVKTDFMWM